MKKLTSSHPTAKPWWMVGKQLKHAQQQMDLTNVYPGRKGGHPVK